jgi:thiazolylpeptide-type bacteriocin precursor
MNKINQHDLQEALNMANLEIDDLQLSEFVDEELLKDGEFSSKVMAASCTTCECCCSCSSI